MVDISTLLLPGSDVAILDLFAINERGEIAGSGMLPNGDVHAIVLVPASAEEIAAANPLKLLDQHPQTCTQSLVTQRIQFPAVAIER